MLLHQDAGKQVNTIGNFFEAEGSAATPRLHALETMHKVDLLLPLPDQGTVSMQLRQCPAGTVTGISAGAYCAPDTASTDRAKSGSGCLPRQMQLLLQQIHGTTWQQQVPSLTLASSLAPG